MHLMPLNCKLQNVKMVSSVMYILHNKKKRKQKKGSRSHFSWETILKDKNPRHISNSIFFQLSYLITFSNVSPLYLWIIKTNPPTEKEAPTGLRIHLGGFLRGNTILCWAVCWGICSGGRGCPVPKGSRFPKDDES